MAFVNLEDIIGVSLSLEQHQQDEEEVFCNLRSAGWSSTVQFLGHHVQGDHALTAEGGSRQDHPKPVTIKQLQALLEVINFYHHFVPATHRLPQRQSQTYCCSGQDWEMKKAISIGKAALWKDALLAHTSHGWEVALMVDASAEHEGAALQKRASPSSDWESLAFFSSCACCARIHHFWYMLGRGPFTILYSRV
jgi:hypothetical protein